MKRSKHGVRVMGPSGRGPAVMEWWSGGVVGWWVADVAAQCAVVAATKAAIAGLASRV
jgi:hypothetical protein